MVWDFGDGTNSSGTTLSTPTHTYNSPGSYTVNLTITSSYGTNYYTSFVTVYSAPAVSFTSNVTSGHSPLTVQFNDTSTGSVPNSWFWDFGDGSSATSQNVTHTYGYEGKYSVNFTATNTYGSNYTLATNYINVTLPVPPVAGFTANTTSGKEPLTVQFNDTSTGYNITSWSWDFGDGANSTSQNITHMFTKAGTYTVALNVTNDGGSNTTTQVISVTTSAIVPIAGFTTSATSGNAPLAVQFKDISTNTPTNWFWDFGDGFNSTSQNPSHSYASVGTFTVNLTVSNEAGANSSILAGAVTVYASGTASPVASFTASQSIGTVTPMTVTFTDTSTGMPTTWSWNFGDGDSTNSTVQNPVHAYTKTGTYAVSLTASNSVGSNTNSRTSFINILTPGVLTSYNNMNIYVSNPEGVKYDVPNGTSDGTYVYVPNTYFFHQVGGFNAPHISTDPSVTYVRGGQFIATTNQSGTFWFTNSGGSGYFDDGLLMVAVNGTIPDDFGLHVRASGYNWVPATPQNSNAGPTSTWYVNETLNETFTKSQFIYGPQTWRPANSAYPMYYGQNTGDTTNTFRIMFIDLRAGVLESGTDNGALKVEYSFNNLTSFAALNVYVWQSASNHGTGIMMTNSLGLSSSDVGPSGYTVIGIPASSGRELHIQ